MDNFDDKLEQRFMAFYDQLDLMQDEAQAAIDKKIYRAFTKHGGSGPVGRSLIDSLAAPSKRKTSRKNTKRRKQMKKLMRKHHGKDA